MRYITSAVWGLLLIFIQGCNSGDSGSNDGTDQQSQINKILGSSSVLINGVAAARAEDSLAQSLAAFAQGCGKSPDVMINGKSAVLMRDVDLADCTGADLQSVSNNVKIGR